jgi:hypothetical protein
MPGKGLILTNAEVLGPGLEERVLYCLGTLGSKWGGSWLLTGLGSFGRLVIETKCISECST